MNAVGSITHARVDACTRGSAGCSPSGAPSLLPAPADVGDAVTRLLEASSQITEQQLLTGKSHVEAADARRKAAAEERKAALERAIEAARRAREAESGGGFFSFVTDNIGATGLIGLATFNWGLVAADLAAHRAELVGPRTGALDLGAATLGGPLFYLAAKGAEELAPEGVGQTTMAATLLAGPMGLALERAAEKITPDDLEKRVDEMTSIEDDDVRLANKVALTVALAAVAAGATVATGGTSSPAIVALAGIGLSTATQVASQTGALEHVLGQKAAVYVALGGAIGGAALTAGGSAWSCFSAGSNAVAMSKAMKSTVEAASAARTVADGASNAIAGAQALEAAHHQRRADLANVDAEAQRHVLARIERIIDDILQDLREAEDSARRAAETLQDTLHVTDKTRLLAGAMKV